MSRVLQLIPVHLQRVALNCGGSVQHGCDMIENAFLANTSGCAPVEQRVIRSEDVPDWVPRAVKSMAMAIQVGVDIARRLLTDPRMQAVWPELKRARVITEEIPGPLPGPAFPPSLQIANLDSLERLKTWDIPDRDVPLQDQACAAFFAFVVIELSNKRIVLTRAQVEKLAQRYLDAANICRSLGEHEAAARVENQVRLSGPNILERSSVQRGDDEIRARVRALATATKRIFGKTLYGTVATVVAVALGIEPVTKKSIINWCKNLSDDGANKASHS